MSKLFNLSTILSNESSLSSASMVRRVEDKVYLSEGIQLLREMDEVLFESTCDMYTSVLEAESKKDENKAFACFFKKYEDVIDSYIRKLQSLASQFAINIETFSDANGDILDMHDSPYILDPPTYKGVKYNYDALTSIGAVDIDPYKVFKKEFAFIGKLLQDLGPLSSEESKTQVIATVCNNLARELDDGWLDKNVKTILSGTSNPHKDEFAKTIYDKFVAEPSQDMTVDVGLVKQCKLDIANCDLFVEVINKSVNGFCKGLKLVADEVGSLFYRNQDHKLPIKTNVDGVEDKTYRLNDYSYNQMNMFITTKISQITELCNLYIVAITIQMDCVYKYLQQCKDVIHTANGGIDTSADKSIEGRDEPDPTPSDDDVEIASDPSIDTTESDDDSAEEDSDIDSSDDDDNSSDDIDMSGYDDNVVEDTPPDEDNSTDDIEEACYLFEANVFQQERYLNQLMLEMYMGELVEEGVKDAAKNLGSNIRDKANAARARADNIFNQISNMITKLKRKIFANFDGDIKAIQANKNAIERAKIPDGWKIERIDIQKLTSFKIPPFNPNDETLTDQGAYYAEKYKDLMAEGDGDAKERIKKKLIAEKAEPYTEDDKRQGLTYVTSGYNEAVKNLDNMVAQLKATKSKITTTASTTPAPASQKTVPESTIDLESTIATYFNEEGEEKEGDSHPVSGGSGGTTGSGGDNSKNVVVENYIKFNSSIASMMMPIHIQAMKKHIGFLKSLATVAGVSMPSAKKDNGEK